MDSVGVGYFKDVGVAEENNENPWLRETVARPRSEHEIIIKETKFIKFLKHEALISPYNPKETKWTRTDRFKPHVQSNFYRKH
jgi:hypothetical protein